MTCEIKMILVINCQDYIFKIACIVPMASGLTHGGLKESGILFDLNSNLCFTDSRYLRFDMCSFKPIVTPNRHRHCLRVYNLLSPFMWYWHLLNANICMTLQSCIHWCGQRYILTILVKFYPYRKKNTKTLRNPVFKHLYGHNTLINS